MQLAVEDVEAVETHLGLHDRRITYTRAVRQHRRAVARYARGVVELLLFRAATAGSHVTVFQPSPSTTATRTCGHERSTTRRTYAPVSHSRPPVAAAAVVVLVAAAVVLFVAVACRVARAPRQMARRALKQLFHHPPFSPSRRSPRARASPALQYDRDTTGRGRSDVRSFARPRIPSAGAPFYESSIIASSALRRIKTAFANLTL